MADRAVDPDEMADDDWVGSVDARGRPHGRGTLRLGKRSRFEGRMHHGCRRGMGTLYVDEASDDETEGDGVMSRLRVPWLGADAAAFRLLFAALIAALVIAAFAAPLGAAWMELCGLVNRLIWSGSIWVQVGRPSCAQLGPDNQVEIRANLCIVHFGKFSALLNVPILSCNRV